MEDSCDALGATHRGRLNADRVMEWGVVLPNSHSLSDDDCDYIGECAEAFLESVGLLHE